MARGRKSSLIMDQSHLTDAAKVAGVNTTAIIISLSGVETAIRLAGLVAALVYTCLKIADWVRDRKERRALESPATKKIGRAHV